MNNDFNKNSISSFLKSISHKPDSWNCKNLLKSPYKPFSIISLFFDSDINNYDANYVYFRN